MSTSTPPPGNPASGAARNRVWIYSDVSPGAVAGGAYMVDTWIEQLTAAGYQVRLFSPSGSRRSWRREDHVAFKTWNDIAAVGDEHARYSALAEVRRAKGELPDVILVASPGRVGMLGLATAQRYDVPLVMVHAFDLMGAQEFYDAKRAVVAVASKVVAMGVISSKLRRRMLDVRSFVRDHDYSLTQRAPFHLLRACQIGAVSVIMLSRKHSEQIQSYVPDVPVHVIPSGVDRLPEAPPPPELTWREGALRVLYVGRFAREKNLFPVVEALKLARDEGVEVDLTIVGEGELGQDLTDRAAELGVSDRFRVIGPYPRPTLRGIYASADVFVFASVSDTQGFVLNEAAHEGLPLLAADPHVNPVVSDGESAYLVPPTARGFADGFAALNDPELRTKLGERAQALAVELSEARQSATVIEILRKAIAREPIEAIRY
jgi:1,2-diacylglycerol 3-alpha-glucosyltransferase